MVHNEIGILAFSNFLGDFVFPHFEDVWMSCLHIDQYESSKGLNTESNNPQRASATVLAELAAGRHFREETHGITQVQGPLER